MHPLAQALLDVDPTIEGSPFSATPSQEATVSPVPNRNASDKVIPLYGTKSPSVEYEREKPIHRVMAYMLARGMSQREIAKATGYSENGVGMVARQVWFRDIVARIVQEEQREGLMDILRAGAVDAIETIKDLTRGAKSEMVRLNAARDLLDRIMGKPVPHEDEESVVPIDPSDELKQLDEELARLRQPTIETQTEKIS